MRTAFVPKTAHTHFRPAQGIVLRFSRSLPSPSKSKSRKAVRISRAQGQASESPKDDKVQEALKRAQEGVATAESSLSNIERLPSNKVQKTSPVMKNISRLLIVAFLAVGFPATQRFGLTWQIILATLGGCGFAGYGYRKGSLSFSGALAACVVGTVTLATSLRIGLCLLSFYYTSSKLTAFKEEMKDVDEEFKKGGQRDWRQVLCNGGIPSVLAFSYGVLTRFADIPLSSQQAFWPTAFLGAAIGYYASCCADTWASELGQLSEDTPVLITTLRPVRKGTNGGVTRLGLFASIGGGLLVGTAAYLGGLIAPTLSAVPGAFEAARGQWLLLPLGLLAGLFGSLVDSVLGATVQFTGYNRTSQKLTSKHGPDIVQISGLPLLTNNVVNLVSAALTALLMASMCLAAF